MSTAAMSRFFAVLALACWAGVAFALVLAVAHRRRPESTLGTVYVDLSEIALWLGATVAVVTTLGSLYYSEIAHFIPCKLCWYQRIAMYPVAIILTVGALRRDRRVWWYVVPLAAIGAAFAVYHAQLQAFPQQHSSFCTTTEPCTIRYVWEFGFMSLPLMAFTAFVTVITFVLIARTPAPRS